jgi:hypothetical protein
MKRIPHFITANKKESRPRRAVFFDTETLQVELPSGAKKLELKLGWCCYWSDADDGDQNIREWCFFTTPETFWSFLSEYLSPDETLYLVAHNIAFDFRIVGGFDYAERNRWWTDSIYAKSMTTLIRYDTGQGVLQLLDMGNFFPTTLAEIGRVVGVEKTEIDFDSCSFQELSDYCRNDVQILVAAWEAWLAFLDEHDLGDFRLTLAAQAMSAYRHSFMEHGIKIHTDKSVCELERAAYRGGRVECFAVGDLSGEVFYQLDVNGMYCYMMQLHDYPRLLKSWPVSLSLKQLRATIKRHCVVARVILRTDVPTFPLRAGSFNIYPVGTFQTVLSTPEIEFALHRCEILSVGSVGIYERAPLFRSYASYFADLKQSYQRDNNMIFRTIAKKFANSLYGKFGQSDIETDLSFDMPPLAPREAPYYDWRTQRWCRIYKLGHQVICERSGGESFNSFPAIPAHVTAYARMYLWSLIEHAGQENVVYCATDSLIVNQRGFDNLELLVDDNKLGYLRVVNVSDKLNVWGPNSIRLGDVFKSAGIRKNAVQLSHDAFEQDQFLGLRGAIRAGDPDLVTVRRVWRRMYRRVKTGVIRPGGKVEPFRLDAL